VPVRNDTAHDGLWKLNGSRQVVYGKLALTVRDRFKAVEALRDRVEAATKGEGAAAKVQESEEEVRAKKQAEYKCKTQARMEAAQQAYAEKMAKEEYEKQAAARNKRH
jgi:hypothetical protein